MKPKPKTNEQRLQRVLAQAGLASRRKAEEFIQTGRVSVDGKVITQLGVKVDPDRQLIKVDGQPIAVRESRVYYLLHKPRLVLSTLHDPQGRPTLKDYLKGARIKERVFPVGRLDWDADGLILLTNDGRLAQILQHPRFQVPKTYRVKVSGLPTREALMRREEGVQIPGGGKHRAGVELIKTGENRAWLLVTIREGEKHQVKKMLEAVGHLVLTLKRVAMGPLKLGRLPVGKIRTLTQEEIQSLRQVADSQKFRHQNKGELLTVSKQ
ncbi:MAG: rRNA pseudouridine synthase [Desulfobacteraceae bacterium]|nr:MAG: rRNA pseudouridine synthase [Desulfobacteraceae bacterium]